MIQTMSKWAGATLLILRVGLIYLLSMAALHGQSTNSVSPTNLLQSAWSEFSSNHYMEAELSFHAAVVADPTNADAYAGLGQCQYHLKDYPWAIRYLERALALEPGHTNWLLFLGESYCRAGDPSKATNLFQKYVSLRTDDAEGYTWLSYALSQVGQYNEAASAARRAITLNPTNNYCYRQLGYCLEQLNRHEDAIQAFRQAIAIDPKNEDTYNQCAFSLVEVGRLDEAATVLEKVSQDNREARWLLLGCYLGGVEHCRGAGLTVQEKTCRKCFSPCLKLFMCIGFCPITELKYRVDRWFHYSPLNARCSYAKSSIPTVLAIRVHRLRMQPSIG
jgi:tetratricopeptide (TPR) repeat protein